MTPPLYVGPSTQARCEQAAEARKTQKLKEVAEALGVACSTARRMIAAHKAMRTFTVTLQREGSPTMTVCQVTTPKGGLTAALAAWREYPGTLKNLELPGWRLVVDGSAFELHELRDGTAQRRAG
ncbi:hypothetical protein [Dyella sp.]|uniref:hypothetical protein n=1 Tax=Dyella sp. TaxID=1869338 RepID=UPI003F80308E